MADSVTAPGVYTFMKVHAIRGGLTANEEFFEGPLPEIGEAVELVLVGVNKDGSMNFQLRTKIA